ncbi:MAG TPA: radical SAM/SPASM domain-containing protein [Pyrinomonadaceae bacterium]|nr:radical SAM/SPASM domain-containing protein [Pyrinomonadaceae bacterium]
MIEIGNRPVVVMQAAPFCFGPASTSLAIASELRKHDVAIVWLAEGTTLRLLRAGQYEDYVIPFSLGEQGAHGPSSHYVEEADVVVVNTDPDFAEFALGLNERTVYVDILYWMWESIPEVAERCELYLYEDFVRVDEQIRRKGMPRNAVRVGPLINPADGAGGHRPATTGGHLLVSLGGLHRPGEARALLSSFGDMVRLAVMDALEQNGEFSEVYIAGDIPRSETTLGNGVRIHTGCLSKEEHQRLLSTARAVVLSPGLTGFYEAAAARVPIFFLPPHNYSQHLQLQSYKAALKEPCYADWEQLGISKKLPCFLPEEEMLREVDAVLAEVVGKGDLLARQLREFLGSGFRYYDPRPAADMLESLEGGGAERAAGEILRRIEAHRGARPEPARRLSLDAAPLPKKVTLELFGGCQLRCPLCPTGNRTRPGRASGPLKVETVAALLDEIGDHVEVIELFNWGEPFLNPDACKIVRMIADRGIRTVLSTNLQLIPDPEEIIASGLDELIVSCHGVTQETYEKYMVGGEVEKTFQNLDRIVAAGGPGMKMKVVLRFVVFAHNEHEVPLAVERFRGTPVVVEAAPMRMDMRDEILNTAGENLSAYGEWVPGSSRFYDKENLKATRAPVGCNLPFEETTIDVDGSVSMCCSSFDPKYNVGNFLSEGFAAVWNGPNYQEARRVVTGRGETGLENVVCRTCKNNGYRDL